jgi:hypothetical protein
MIDELRLDLAIRESDWSATVGLAKSDLDLEDA